VSALGEREATSVELPAPPVCDRAEAGRKLRRGWVIRRALLAADVFGLVTAFVVAALLTPWDQYATNAVGGAREATLFALSLPFWVIGAKLYGLYDRDEEQVDRSRADDLIGVFTLVTVGSWLVFAFTRLTELATPSMNRLLLFWVVAITLISVLRVVARCLCKRHSSFVQNTVIVGAGIVGQLVARKLLERPDYGVRVLGFVDAHPRERDDRLGDLTILGRLEDLPQIVAERDVERVLFAFSSDRDYEAVPLLRMLAEAGVQIQVVPRFFDVIGPGLDVHSVGGLPILGARAFRLERSAQLLKRALDLAVSAVLLILLLPLFLVIAVAIKLDSPGPIFFRQVRIGAKGRPFRICKFRTMSVDADRRKQELAHLNQHLSGDPRMFKVPDDPRVTHVGRHLRRFALDELPQLFNVFVGEMSLVGPRPLILDEDRHVNGWARRRLDLKPGITGLWQVHGASEIPFEEMIKLDYRYVAGWSLKGDLELMARTIPAVLRERNAY